MTHLQMLQALATLDRRIHALRDDDGDDIALWCRLAGPCMEMHLLTDKTLENIGACYRRYFE